MTTVEHQQDFIMARALVSSTVCAAALLGLGACASLEPVAQTYAPPPVGASWEFAQRATGSYGSDTRQRVTRVEDLTWQGKPVIVFRGPQTQTLADPATGRWRAITRLDGALVTLFEPDMGWNHPIRVGNQHTAKQQVTMPALNRTTAFDQVCTVMAFEKVTVPAGSYDTFRIRCTTTAGHDETHWYAPTLGIFVKQRLIRSALNPSGAGTQDSELLWYAPSSQ